MLKNLAIELKRYNLELYLAHIILSEWEKQPEFKLLNFAIIQIKYQGNIIFEQECFISEEQRLKNFLTDVKTDNKIASFKKRYDCYQNLEINSQYSINEDFNKNDVKI